MFYIVSIILQVYYIVVYHKAYSIYDFEALPGESRTVVPHNAGRRIIPKKYHNIRKLFGIRFIMHLYAL